MKELSIEQKAKAYDEALKVLHKYDGANIMFSQSLKEEMFPELIESEDERIKKRIIEWIEEIRKCNPNNAEHNGDCSEAIAWLEKQGEHAKFRDSIQVGDKVTRNQDGVLVNLSQLNRVAKKDEKQGKNNIGISEATKQKLEYNLNKALEKETPESWNEFLDKQGEQNLVKHFCDCVHVGCHVNDCKRWCHSYQKEISYTDCNSNCNRYSKPINSAFNIGETITDGISTFKIADIKDNYYIADDGERIEIYMAHRYYTTIQNLEAQKPALSEEDEKTIVEIRDFFIRVLGDKPDFTEDKRYEEFIEFIDNRLKSLKDRVQPQPKQEWSEDDEDMRDTIIHDLKRLGGDIVNVKPAYKAEIDWLKSLRPQNTWKPSEEQMHYLSWIANIKLGDSVVEQEVSKHLNELLEDLKKLRGE